MEYSPHIVDQSAITAKDFSPNRIDINLIMETCEKAEGNSSGSTDDPAPPNLLTVRARIDPGSLERVTNVFTQRGFIPASLSCRRADPFLLIDVQLTPEDSKADGTLLERLRALVCVDQAEYVAELPAPLAA